MSKTSRPLLPAKAKRLVLLGERLRLARLRRQFTGEVVAARARITRKTLYRIEKGEPTVSMGSYLNVMAVLQLDADIDLIAKDDELGRRLQDLQLPVSARASRKRSS